MSRPSLASLLELIIRSPSVTRAAPRLHLSKRWSLSAVPFRSLATTRCLQYYAQSPSLDPQINDGVATSQGHARVSDVGANDDASSSSAAASLTLCPGCGALAQTVKQNEAGYYNVKRRAVVNYTSGEKGQSTVPPSEEMEVYHKAISLARPELLESVVSVQDVHPDPADAEPHMPLCDRCHDLIHHHKGVPIHHPSLESIEDTIAESPYKHNHIYHVLDAADFPMSLVPSIQRVLDISPQRTRNRRAKHSSGWRHGRKMEMSFIITRSDLLAPKKEQVDRMMPYLNEVLREALGRNARNVRLGNVRCVSAKRGWWTREVKADIWRRGGAGWLLGKVNVGKSNLFEVVFPKGKAEDINFDSVRNAARIVDLSNAASSEQEHNASELVSTASEEENFMLPPARQEVPFPTMPTVSSLPGTTASPIRIPFGNGKGELIDLPGLARGELESFVQPEHRQDLVMKSRISPEQYTIKPGQSLLLGGLVRITPVNQDMIILAYPFVPIESHVTSTQKVHDMTSGVKAPVSSIITADGVLGGLESAGRYPLKWDVTKSRAGPLTTRSAVGLREDRLPFRVLSADILVESLGWIELVAQVRRRDFDGIPADDESDPWADEEEATPTPEQPLKHNYPEVEVFSPKGKFISIRRPLGAWLMSNKAPLPASRRKTRPRRSMAGAKDGR